MRHFFNVIFSLIAIIFLFSLFLFTDHNKNVKSESEKRFLANPPEASFLSNDYKRQFSSWLGDHILLRRHFLSIKNFVSYDIFDIKSSISNNVQNGKDGFLFTSIDFNIEIATQSYKITEKELKDFAQTVQKISDYYKSQGKNYILLIHPSKATIYPEKLYGNYKTGTTLCDELYEYISKNTDVKIINIKKYLLEKKGKDFLYWKKDSHWTPLGNYWAYYSIIDSLNNFGLTNEKELPLKFSNNSIQGAGDLASLLGMKETIETARAVDFTNTAFIDDKSAYSKKIQEAFEKTFTEKNDKRVLYTFSNNGENSGKKIFIYADSQFWPGDKTDTKMLAQHFENLTYLWTYQLFPEIDEASGADIIIQAIPEGMVLAKIKNLKDFIDTQNQVN